MRIQATPSPPTRAVATTVLGLLRAPPRLKISEWAKGTVTLMTPVADS